MFLEIIGATACIIIVVGAVAVISFLVNSNNTLNVQRKEAEQKVAAYKGILHNLADSMHNIGRPPFYETNNELRDLDSSLERMENIRSLMRTLRFLAQTDMRNMNQYNIPYAEIIDLVNIVVYGMGRHLNVTTELIKRIEDKADHDDFNSIRDIVQSIKASLPDNAGYYTQIAPIIQNKIQELYQETITLEKIELVLKEMFPDFNIIIEAADRANMSIEQYVADTPDFYRLSRYREALAQAQERVNFMYSELISILENGLYDAYADFNDYLLAFWAHLSGIEAERNLQMKLLNEDSRFEPVTDSIEKQFGVKITRQLDLKNRVENGKTIHYFTGVFQSLKPTNTKTEEENK